jgi:hypothetical protein
MATESGQNRSRALSSGDEELKLFQHISQALRGLEFGTVTIVVQNGRVVQIERHEKLRLIPNDRGRQP